MKREIIVFVVVVVRFIDEMLDCACFSFCFNIIRLILLVRSFSCMCVCVCEGVT